MREEANPAAGRVLPIAINSPCKVTYSLTSGHYMLSPDSRWTGARRTELAAIQWHDIYLAAEDGQHYIRIENFKTNSERSVPVAPRLMRHLLRWGGGTRTHGPIVGQVFAPDTLGHMLCDVIESHGEIMPVFGELNAKATGNGWHLLCHTFASWAAMAGVDIRVIKEWLDHRCITTTTRYLAVRPTTSAHLDCPPMIRQCLWLMRQVWGREVRAVPSTCMLELHLLRAQYPNPENNPKNVEHG